MARPKELGLDYFTIDVNIFENDKIQLIMAEFGSEAFTVFTKILCLIYQKNGYYYIVDDDKKLLLAKALNLKGSLVGEIIAGLVRRSLFNKRVFDSFSVLTSKQIQANYLEAVKKRKSVEIDEKLLLVDKEKYANIDLKIVNSTLTPVNSTLTPVNDELSTQSKVKESKVQHLLINFVILLY